MQEAEPLQQVRRTYIRHRGTTLTYFGGCDYFRFASHPKVLRAVRDGMRRYGLNVAASRITTGNHAVYGQLESELARFFGAESALLANSGYVTNLMVAQALAGQFSHALIDERAHVALQDAVAGLNCPVLRFKHRDITDFAETLQRCGQQARPVVLTDGLFAHNGSIAPLTAYLKLLPRDGWIVVDDAHGAGTVGPRGRGSVELERVDRDRIVQNITLSKAFGVYGGAILCSKAMRKKLTQTHLFLGSTPLPLPLAFAATESIRLLKKEKRFRSRLSANAEHIKSALVKAGLALERFPGPIVPIHLNSAAANQKFRAALFQAKILPPFLTYPGSPAGGYFRFVISSEHTKPQLDALVRTLVCFTQDSAA